MMDLGVYIQLIFLCIVNIVFTFSGIILNTLVIASLLKSSQLRKKLCYFMILVLSCFDFVAVITNHPLILFHLVVWLTENYALLHKLEIYAQIATVFLGFSFFALLVTNIERYLGTYYPIYHRTSVTRRRLLTFLAMLLIFDTVKIILTIVKVIPPAVGIMIFVVVTFPPFMFINSRLYRISKENRRNNAISPQKRTKINLKNVSICLLAAACVAVLSIPSALYFVFSFVGEARSTNARLSYVWGLTLYTMNSSFNMQFNLFLEKQSSTCRRNKDTKHDERSCFWIPRKRYTDTLTFACSCLRCRTVHSNRFPRCIQCC